MAYPAFRQRRCPPRGRAQRRWLEAKLGDVDVGLDAAARRGAREGGGVPSAQPHGALVSLDRLHVALLRRAPRRARASRRVAERPRAGGRRPARSRRARRRRRPGPRSRRRAARPSRPPARPRRASRPSSRRPRSRPGPAGAGPPGRGPRARGSIATRGSSTSSTRTARRRHRLGERDRARLGARQRTHLAVGERLDPEHREAPGGVARGPPFERAAASARASRTRIASGSAGSSGTSAICLRTAASIGRRA